MYEWEQPRDREEEGVVVVDVCGHACVVCVWGGLDGILPGKTTGIFSVVFFCDSLPATCWNQSCLLQLLMPAWQVRAIYINNYQSFTYSTSNPSLLIP